MIAPCENDASVSGWCGEVLRQKLRKVMYEFGITPELHTAPPTPPNDCSAASFL